MSGVSDDQIAEIVQRLSPYAETLRANRAEAALKDAERKLGRLLQMADAWENEEFPKMARAAMFSEAVRTVILPW